MAIDNAKNLADWYANLSDADRALVDKAAQELRETIDQKIIQTCTQFARNPKDFENG